MTLNDPAAKPVVLVVEDEVLLRMHAADLLEDQGYSVVEAINADEAIGILESRRDVRLLFTDIQMPGRYDGMELARQVHARWPKILLVITSGRLEPDPSDISDDARFVGKPYSNDALMSQVTDLISKP